MRSLIGDVLVWLVFIVPGLILLAVKFGYDGLIISEFCKVDFLCFQAEPHWLGYVVFVVGVLIAYLLLTCVCLGIAALLAVVIDFFIAEFR